MYQGAKWILLKQKKRSRKSHAWAPLRDICIISLTAKDNKDRKFKHLLGKSAQGFSSMIALYCANFMANHTKTTGT
jgi:hypothetical protein